MSDPTAPSLVHFEYCYRDASNFKAYGNIGIVGILTVEDREEIVSRLEDGQFFMAEQVGLPTLYHKVYGTGGGPQASDHCWHEFVAFNDAHIDPENAKICEEANYFLARFRSVGDWNIGLSPHVSEPLEKNAAW